MIHRNPFSVHDPTNQPKSSKGKPVLLHRVPDRYGAQYNATVSKRPESFSKSDYGTNKNSLSKNNRSQQTFEEEASLPVQQSLAGSEGDDAYGSSYTEIFNNANKDDSNNTNIAVSAGRTTSKDNRLKSPTPTSFTRRLRNPSSDRDVLNAAAPSAGWPGPSPAPMPRSDSGSQQQAARTTQSVHNNATTTNTTTNSNSSSSDPRSVMKDVRKAIGTFFNTRQRVLLEEAFKKMIPFEAQERSVRDALLELEQNRAFPERKEALQSIIQLSNVMQPLMESQTVPVSQIQRVNAAFAIAVQHIASVERDNEAKRDKIESLTHKLEEKEKKEKALLLQIAQFSPNLPSSIGGMSSIGSSEEDKEAEKQGNGDRGKGGKVGTKLRNEEEEGERLLDVPVEVALLIENNLALKQHIESLERQIAFVKQKRMEDGEEHAQLLSHTQAVAQSAHAEMKKAQEQAEQRRREMDEKEREFQDALTQLLSAQEEIRALRHHNHSISLQKNPADRGTESIYGAKTVIKLTDSLDAARATLLRQQLQGTHRQQRLEQDLSTARNKLLHYEDVMDGLRDQLERSSLRNSLEFPIHPDFLPATQQTTGLFHHASTLPPPPPHSNPHSRRYAATHPDSLPAVPYTSGSRSSPEHHRAQNYHTTSESIQEMGNDDSPNMQKLKRNAEEAVQRHTQDLNRNIVMEHTTGSVGVPRKVVSLAATPPSHKSARSHSRPHGFDEDYGRNQIDGRVPIRQSSRSPSPKPTKLSLIREHIHHADHAHANTNTAGGGSGGNNSSNSSRRAVGGNPNGEPIRAFPRGRSALLGSGSMDGRGSRSVSDGSSGSRRARSSSPFINRADNPGQFSAASRESRGMGQPPIVRRSLSTSSLHRISGERGRTSASTGSTHSLPAADGSYAHKSGTYYGGDSNNGGDIDRNPEENVGQERPVGGYAAAHTSYFDDGFLTHPGEGRESEGYHASSNFRVRSSTDAYSATTGLERGYVSPLTATPIGSPSSRSRKNIAFSGHGSHSHEREETAQSLNQPGTLARKEDDEARSSREPKSSSLAISTSDLGLKSGIALTSPLPKAGEKSPKNSTFLMTALHLQQDGSSPPEGARDEEAEYESAANSCMHSNDNSSNKNNNNVYDHAHSPVARSQHSGSADKSKQSQNRFNPLQAVSSSGSFPSSPHAPPPPPPPSTPARSTAAQASDTANDTVAADISLSLSVSPSPTHPSRTTAGSRRPAPHPAPPPPSTPGSQRVLLDQHVENESLRGDVQRLEIENRVLSAKNQDLKELISEISRSRSVGGDELEDIRRSLSSLSGAMLDSRKTAEQDAYPRILAPGISKSSSFALTEAGSGVVGNPFEINKYQEKLQKAKRKIDKLSSSLKEKEALINSLNIDLEKLRAANEEELLKRTQKIEFSDKENQELAAEMATVKTELEQARERLTQERNICLDFERDKNLEIADVQQKLGELMATHTAAEDRVRELEVKLHTQEAVLSEKSRKLETVMLDNATTKAKLIDVYQQRDTEVQMLLQKQQQDLQIEYEEKIRERSCRESEEKEGKEREQRRMQEAHREKVHALEDAVAQKEREAREIYSELAEANRKVLELQLEVDRQNAHFREAHSKILDLGSKSVEMEETKAQLHAEMARKEENAHRKITELEKELRVHSGSLDELHQNERDLRQALRNSERVKDTEVATLQEASQNQFKELSHRINNLEQELSEKDALISRLQEELETAKTRNFETLKELEAQDEVCSRNQQSTDDGSFFLTQKHRKRRGKQPKEDMSGGKTEHPPKLVGGIADDGSARKGRKNRYLNSASENDSDSDTGRDLKQRNPKPYLAEEYSDLEGEILDLQARKLAEKQEIDRLSAEKIKILGQLTDLQAKDFSSFSLALRQTAKIGPQTPELASLRGELERTQRQYERALQEQLMQQQDYQLQPQQSQRPQESQNAHASSNKHKQRAQDGTDPVISNSERGSVASPYLDAMDASVSDFSDQKNSLDSGTLASRANSLSVSVSPTDNFSAYPSRAKSPSARSHRGNQGLERRVEDGGEGSGREDDRVLIGVRKDGRGYREDLRSIAREGESSLANGEEGKHGSTASPRHLLKHHHHQMRKSTSTDRVAKSAGENTGRRESGALLSPVGSPNHSEDPDYLKDYETKEQQLREALEQIVQQDQLLTDFHAEHRRLEAKCQFLEYQLSAMPPNLAVAQAEKRVLEGKLQKAVESFQHRLSAQDADADKRVMELKAFLEVQQAEKAALERRLREQSQTVHQLSHHLSLLRTQLAQSPHGVESFPSHRSLSRPLSQSSPAHAQPHSYPYGRSGDLQSQKLSQDLENFRRNKDSSTSLDNVGLLNKMEGGSGQCSRSSSFSHAQQSQQRKQQRQRNGYPFDVSQSLPNAPWASFTFPSV